MIRQLVEDVVNKVLNRDLNNPLFLSLPLVKEEDRVLQHLISAVDIQGSFGHLLAAALFVLKLVFPAREVDVSEDGLVEGLRLARDQDDHVTLISNLSDWCLAFACFQGPRSIVVFVRARDLIGS